MNHDIFVKLNYKTIGEFKSLILDREKRGLKKDKYIMCTGKYDKDGWTFIFKANSMEEAEEIISINSKNIDRDNINKESRKDKIAKFIDNDRVQIPYFIYN